MRVYLVGGAVRDELLGIPPKERDWVITGADPKYLSGLGFEPVGRDFPVFLHPYTHEEYALARTEKKTSQGYQGFTIHASPEVTLEEDLSRRDLTINAIARSAEGTLFDPYNGLQDIQNRLLRHIGPAFTEDPVRILRLARLYAKLTQPWGFQVASETRRLLEQMVQAGELDHLVPNRVWQELSKGLLEPHPEAMFELLEDIKAWPALMPEIAASWPHQRTTVYSYLSQFNGLTLSNRWIVLFYLLHPDSTQKTKIWLSKWPIPRAITEGLECLWSYTQGFGLKDPVQPEKMLTLLTNLDAFRRPDRFWNTVYLVHFMDKRPMKPIWDAIKQWLQAPPKPNLNGLLSPTDIKAVIHKTYLEALQQIWR